MARKKSNKVKNYVKGYNALRNFGTIIYSLVFLAVGIFTSALLVISVINNQTLSSDTDMKELVSITEDLWTVPGSLEKQVCLFIDGNPAIDRVFFVDDDLNVIKSVGSEEEKEFSKYGLEQDFVQSFKKTGIYRDINYYLDAEYDLSRAKGFINPIRFKDNKALIDWAQGKGQAIPGWLIYKSAIDDVNVCVYYKSVINRFQAHQLYFGYLCVTLFIILALFSGVFFFFSLARRRRYVYRIIYTDPVTGGNNRDYFINEALKIVKKGRQYAVVQFRLEKYGNYCTAYGLKRGEKLLEKIYWAAKMNLHKKEPVAHLEKADYAMLLQYSGREQLEQRLNDMVSGFYMKDSHLVFSAGIYPVLSKKEDMSEILTATSLALAKTAYQNSNIVWFNDKMKEEQIWERRVEDDMEKALKNHEFQVYLQPKYSTKNEKLAAAEALVRWTHPEMGFIRPDKFVPIFERNGFILQLDDYMLREIAKLQAIWMNEGKNLVPISVNVSRAHFSMDDLAEHIRDIVDEFSVPHQYIELELTESAFFDDKATLLSTVKKLKKYGFRISMDDFGAGYSSLNSLKELPLDIIKLDAEFFRGIDDVNRANSIVGDTIRLAKKLGMEIVAEGIETREQVDFLAGQNCDLIQGFYFAKPLPVSEFAKRAFYQ